MVSFKNPYRWHHADGLLDSEGRQVLQIVATYCTGKGRDHAGRLLANAMNAEALAKHLDAERAASRGRGNG